jgi:hypothetical protein
MIASESGELAGMLMPASPDAVAELFAEFGSAVAAAIVAVFEMAAETVAGEKTKVNVACAPLASDAIVQLIVPVPPADGVVQVNGGPLFCVALTKVDPAGTGSVIVTLAASLGPLFTTATVNATAVFVGAVPAFLVIARSAEPLTVVEAVALLFPEAKSAVAVETVAVLLIVEPAALAATRTVSVKVAVDATAREALVQETLPVAPTAGVVQVNPAGDASETNVVFAGSVSARVTFTAAFGPLFVTAIV